MPFIAGGVLLAIFIGVVVWSGNREQDTEATPPVAAKPAPAPVPEAEPPREVTPEPPPEPAFTAAQAEKRLLEVTKEWRLFTLQLCKDEKWKSEKAIAFLQKVTWNDRDLDKQHAHGLASIRKMLGAETEDPVALVTALEKSGTLSNFFTRNWSKVAVDWKPQIKAKVLEDAWKPNRIRWGFPLDAPVEDLQEFQHVGLRVTADMWHSLVGTYINELAIDEGEKMTRMQAAIGDDRQSRETKMRAALRVLFDMPKGTVKQVVEELLAQIQKQGQEEFAKTLTDRLDDAIKAAEKAE